VERQIRPKRERTGRAIRDRAQELYNVDPEPTWAAIAADLNAEFPDKAPSARAIAQWAAKGWIVKSAPDARWSISDADAPEDIPLVLDVIRSQIEDPWPTPWPTKAVAKWIVRIRRAYPDLDDLVRVNYLARLARQGEEARVTRFLVFVPWRDEGAALYEAASRNLVPMDTLLGNDLVVAYMEWHARREMAARKESGNG
jgi:hypothetical protein